MSIDVEVRGHVATIVINRPEAMNALDPEHADALKAAFNRVAEDDQVRVTLLAAEGDRAFSTGSDLKKTMPPKESFVSQMLASNLIARRDTDKPLVCAINGYALGGGLEMALSCDIRIASENARFGLPEVRVGSIPGGGGTQRLPRVVGLSNAMHMLLTGEHIDAQEALRIGLISRITTLDRLRDDALAIAERIAANAPLAVRAVKRVAMRGLDLPLAAALDQERTMFGLLRDTEDRIEGRRAFQEKRPPVYQGR